MPVCSAAPLQKGLEMGRNTGIAYLFLKAGGAWKGGGCDKARGQRRRSRKQWWLWADGQLWAVRRPARACPRDKETPWLRGESATPTPRRGH